MSDVMGMKPSLTCLTTMVSRTSTSPFLFLPATKILPVRELTSSGMSSQEGVSVPSASKWVKVSHSESDLISTFFMLGIKLKSL